VTVIFSKMTALYSCWEAYIIIIIIIIITSSFFVGPNKSRDRNQMLVATGNTKTKHSPKSQITMR